MIKEKILVIGASGQIGVELTLALRKIYGEANVIASDLREQSPLLQGTGPYVSLDVMNKEMLHVQVIRQGITQIYLLAAILSATGEKNPGLAWHLNMQGLLNVLDIAKFTDALPDIFVVSLDRLPSHGRQYIQWLWEAKKRQHIPVIFVDGKADKVEETKTKFPNARYCTSNTLVSVVENLV